MAAVHPHTMAIISTSAFHDVIRVVRLRYLIVWINYYLWEGGHEQVRDDREGLMTAAHREFLYKVQRNMGNITWKM